MIGAAKRLKEGKSIGIDIWRHEDMANNNLDMTMRNVELEGVAEIVEIRSEDIRKTSFNSNLFDVVLSNLCLHNISNKNERDGACREINRILKPGGIAVIGDLFFVLKNTAPYSKMRGCQLRSGKGKVMELKLFLSWLRSRNLQGFNIQSAPCIRGPKHISVKNLETSLSISPGRSFIFSRII